jgi:hypoxanthine phosphoribosyltransferase
MKTNYQNVAWTEIENLTKLLYAKISAISKDFSSISTISRGGLVHARLLADYMGIDVIFVDKNNPLVLFLLMVSMILVIHLKKQFQKYLILQILYMRHYLQGVAKNTQSN